MHIAWAQLLSETASTDRIFSCRQHLDLILESYRAGSEAWKCVPKAHEHLCGLKLVSAQGITAVRWVGLKPAIS